MKYSFYLNFDFCRLFVLFATALFISNLQIFLFYINNYVLYWFLLYGVDELFINKHNKTNKKTWRR